MLALLSLVAPALAGEPATVATTVTEAGTVLTAEGEMALEVFLEQVDTELTTLDDGRLAVLLAPAVLDGGELLLPAEAVVDLEGGIGLVAIGITNDHRGVDAVAIGITNDHLGIEQVAIGITQVATSTSIREIVKEREILRRERTVGLSASAYVLSKLTIAMPSARSEASTAKVKVSTRMWPKPSNGIMPTDTPSTSTS